MKKVKIILAITLACMAGCSTDGKSNNGEVVSCRFRETTTCDENEHNCRHVYYAFSMNEGTCVEIQMTELKEKQEDITVAGVENECTKQHGNENNESIFSDGVCPSGYVKKCVSKKIYTAYYYGENFKDKDCNELGFWGDFEEDAPD